jgi:serine/threonine-protein kinase
MKKAGFYKTDWFVALIIGLVFAVAALFGAQGLRRAELLAYDAGVRMTNRAPGATANIAIIAIDDPSIREIGRWPWPRGVLADMVELLAAAEARVVGLLIFLTEPQNDPGLVHIRRLRAWIETNPLPRTAQAQSDELGQMLGEAEAELDADTQLARTIPDAHNVYLPMYFELGQPLGKPDAPLPEFVARNRLTTIVTRGGSNGGAAPSLAVTYPLERFGASTAGIGHLNLGRDAAEGVRGDSLVVEHYGDFYPSLALLVAARSLNLGPADIQVELGEGVRAGQLAIRTDGEMQMYTGFYPPVNGESAFATYSFSDVRAGKVAPEVFRNKIVLIGSTAVGVGSLHATPLGAMSGPELTANVVASILNQDFYVRPAWMMWTEIALFVVVVAYLMFGVPRLGALPAAAVSAVLLIALIGGTLYLLAGQKIWLQGITPALLLVTGHVLLTTKRFLLTERQKAEAETDSAQTNRMLGLAFQGQGQLDMALDKFRKLPVDESVLELFYNLALDFERKRQFSKAGNCYDTILRHDPKYRDAAERKQRAIAAEQTVILGGGKKAGPTGTLVLGAAEKPRLGRYEVEKELGHGAMGTVYLGRDPRINRTVAIKTLALTQFEDAELPQVRERFFREAETAGRLSHPNIVTIYDAGEEHDLAFIAMELLEGKDLTHYIRPEKPLPLAWVVGVVAKVADALDYAHRQGVVHRDIKPANIMYNESAKSVKVTDFGIARVAASSRTKTGMVLGTPSYMSPEQIAGKHVDGRSDLFSLGAMLFEMLTAQQPFSGDSLATLMFQITTGAHPDVTALRPDVPACLRAVLDKALAKDPEARYRSGAEFRQVLLECAAGHAGAA